MPIPRARRTIYETTSGDIEPVRRLYRVASEYSNLGDRWLIEVEPDVVPHAASSLASALLKYSTIMSAVS